MIARLTARLSVERLAWMAAVASIIVIGFLAIGAHDHRYFYIDDTESGAVGNWIQLGHILRDGQFPSLVLDQWMAGNYPVEGQGGLWNPVQMLINYLAPSFDDLALLAAVVKCVFSIILGWGLFRVAIEYGARAEWAAVAGACAPFAGFTLFFEQTSWITSLIGMAWVMQAWASGVRYARGRSGPVPVFAFLYLAISVGYVHATIMAGVVVGALVIGERMYQRSWIRPLRLAAAGVAAASCGAITFLPGVLTSDVTWRTGDGGVVNDNFLTAPWSETITASIPTAVTSIQSWSGETTFAPVTYIGWFVIPALAFVAWRSVVPALRELTAPLVVLGTVLVITAGPSEIGQIRWPARLLPFAAVVMLILAVVLLSRFGTTRPLRPRLVAATLIVLVLVLRASSSGPQFFGRHVLSALFILTFGATAVYLSARMGSRAVAVLFMITIVPIAFYQVSTFSNVLIKWYLPASQSDAKSHFPQFQGTTLQLGDRSLIRIDAESPEIPWQSQVYGNYAKVLDLPYVNAYTPVGHRDFSNLLCMAFDGSTCPDAFNRAFAIDPYTGRTIVDLLKVDRVVCRKAVSARKSASTATGLATGSKTTGRKAATQILVLERDNGPISARIRGASPRRSA